MSTSIPKKTIKSLTISQKTSKHSNKLVSNYQHLYKHYPTTPTLFTLCVSSAIVSILNLQRTKPQEDSSVMFIQARRKHFAFVCLSNLVVHPIFSHMRFTFLFLLFGPLTHRTSQIVEKCLCSHTEAIRVKWTRRRARAKCAAHVRAPSVICKM